MELLCFICSKQEQPLLLDPSIVWCNLRSFAQKILISLPRTFWIVKMATYCRHEDSTRSISIRLFFLPLPSCVCSLNGMLSNPGNHLYWPYWDGLLSCHVKIALWICIKSPLFQLKITGGLYVLFMTKNIIPSFQVVLCLTFSLTKNLTWKPVYFEIF